MARHALFPETRIESEFQASLEDSTNDENMTESDNDLDALLATLEGWSSQDKTQESEASISSFDNSSATSESVRVEELQAWRNQHFESGYDGWSPEKKQEFMVSYTILEITERLATSE